MNKTLKEMEKYLENAFGEAKAKEVLALAESRLAELISENINDPKEIKAHRENNIFPCISLYESLEKCGIPKKEALDFLDKSWSERARKSAEATSKMLHCFGLYRLYPGIFTKVAKKQFGTNAGFQAKFYDCGKEHSKFDMTKCLFKDTCKKYNCQELTKCFCHVDDINNANLHPRLKWNRSQFMGDGADYCDFDIFVTPKDK